jgi:hypothetical protein
MIQLEEAMPAGLELAVSPEELCVLWRAAGTSRPVGAPNDVLEGLEGREFAVAFQTALDGLVARGLVDRHSPTEYQVPGPVLELVRRAGHTEGILRLVRQLGDRKETRFLYGDRAGCLEHAALPGGGHRLRAVEAGSLVERLVAYARAAGAVATVGAPVEIDRAALIELAEVAARDGAAAARAGLRDHGVDPTAAALLADALAVPVLSLQLVVAFAAADGDSAGIVRRQLAVLDGGRAGCWLEQGDGDHARLRQVDGAGLQDAIGQVLVGTAFFRSGTEP